MLRFSIPCSRSGKKVSSSEFVKPRTALLSFANKSLKAFSCGNEPYLWRAGKAYYLHTVRIRPRIQRWIRPGNYNLSVTHFFKWQVHLCWKLRVPIAFILGKEVRRPQFLKHSKIGKMRRIDISRLFRNVTQFFRFFLNAFLNILLWCIK